MYLSRVKLSLKTFKIMVLNDKIENLVKLPSFNKVSFTAFSLHTAFYKRSFSPRDLFNIPRLRTSVTILKFLYPMTAIFSKKGRSKLLKAIVPTSKPFKNLKISTSKASYDSKKVVF